jgi:hypothetical protein
MVASAKPPAIHIRELNGLRRKVRQTTARRIDARPKLFAHLDWLLLDGPERDDDDDLRDLEGRIGR